MYAVRATYWTWDDMGTQQVMHYPVFYVTAANYEQAEARAREIVGDTVSMRIRDLGWAMDVAFGEGER